MNGDVRSELLALEHDGWRSLCDGTGADFYGRLMITDGVMVLAGGFSLDRASVIASLVDAPTWDTYRIDDERVISIATDVFAITYIGRASRGDEPEFAAAMSSTYVRVDGEWRLALYQQTPVASR
ncbi:DUF4440 domain-containing protein [Paramicrobacterium sp. CJ85]|uniref:DUF4440 domain-containing protein n=1 Tax=Paramicrobacterium sp. CJ85 TaxID=3445355 RepID=UPI003F5ED1D8